MCIKHTLAIHFHRNSLRLQRMHGLQSRRIGKFFDKHEIAWIEKHVEDLVQRVGITARHEDIVIAVCGYINFLHKLE